MRLEHVMNFLWAVSFFFSGVAFVGASFYNGFDAMQALAGCALAYIAIKIAG